MKRKTAALYNPYLDSLGGGEKHVLSILKVLEEEGYEINIFWDQNLSQEIKKRLNINFSSLKFLPNIFKNKSVFNKVNFLNNFDVFIYVTDGSYFFSTAKNNFVFSMVPNRKLYPTNFLDRLKTINYRFISNSQFTGNLLQHWGLKNTVIYPRLDAIFLKPAAVKKEKIILSVGRFFPHLHSKKQEILIDTFVKLSKNQQQFSDWKLILIGGLKKDDQDYFNQLKKTTDTNKQILLLPNLSYEELINYYQKATLFWHFTGYGVDENQHPEMVEHLGITPLEAMATGAITFCVNAGGPKEIIKDGNNGFLFEDQEEIIKKSISIINNQDQQKIMINNAHQFVHENFGEEVFKKNVINNIID